MKFVLSCAIVLLASGMGAPVASAQARNVQMMGVQEEPTPYLGVGGQDVSPERASSLKLKEVRGAEVTMVNPDTPAAKAGIKDGDVILEYNGQKVEGWEQLKRLVAETPIGREVKIVVWRNGSNQTVTAVIGSHKQQQDMFFGRPFPMPEMRIEPPVFSMPQFRTFSTNSMLGIVGEPLGQEAQLAEYFGVKDGVLIRSVERNSAAEKAGMKAGDVITKIGDAGVSTNADVIRGLRAAARRPVPVTVIRRGKEMTLSVTVDGGVVTRGGLDTWSPEWNNWVLEFVPDDGVVQGAKKGGAKIVWQ